MSNLTELIKYCNPASLLRDLTSNIQIAKYSLGKYIVGYACLLHFLWAILIGIDSRAGNSTPLSILFILFGHNRALIISLLLLVSAMATAFLSFRARQIFNIRVLTVLLLPQQVILWMSAGGGIYATLIQHYADGVPRSWVHILADQLPVILAAFLYTTALLETRTLPDLPRALKT